MELEFIWKSFVPLCVTEQSVSIRQKGKHLVATEKTIINIYNAVIKIMFGVFLNIIALFTEVLTLVLVLKKSMC